MTTEKLTFNYRMYIFLIKYQKLPCDKKYGSTLLYPDDDGVKYAPKAI